MRTTDIEIDISELKELITNCVKHLRNKLGMKTEKLVGQIAVNNSDNKRNIMKAEFA